MTNQEARKPAQESAAESADIGQTAPEGADVATPPEATPGEGGNDSSGLREELDRTRDQLLRALAESENIRRRAAKEREDASRFAVTAFARDLLDFVDNFNRALGSVPPELKEESDERVRNLLAGVEAMEQQALRTLEKHGIRKLVPMNEMFDPNFHEVMFEAPGTGKPGNMIVQVIEPGYTLHGRLLRPARVGVARDEGTAHKVDTRA